VLDVAGCSGSVTEDVSGNVCISSALLGPPVPNIVAKVAVAKGDTVSMESLVPDVPEYILDYEMNRNENNLTANISKIYLKALV
jgi:hypothetical protein